jgi:hypothetical protein
MISELAEILPDFSQVNHMRCFLHIVNLCAKLIIKQFDVPKQKDDEHLDEAVRELQGDDNDKIQNLAGDQDLEEQQTHEGISQRKTNGQGAEEEDEDDDDDIEGWIDEMELLSPAEHAGLEESIRPVKLVLVKVSWGID